MVGSTSYAYDGLSNRISQTNSGYTTTYINDVQPGLTQVVAQINGASTDRFVHGPRGVQAQHDGTNWQHIAQDGLGSVRTIIDNTLNVDTVHTYDPIGNPLGSYGADFGFTGEMRDPNGLNYHRARYYDPSIGIWTALDPFEGVVDQPRCWHQSRLL